MERKVIAHVDADCFYVSCERLRDPSLNGKPVAVCSSVNAIVIARSYELKPHGVTVGSPTWEVRKVVPNAIFYPADFQFYGHVSYKMFEVLKSISPELEIYGIDEGFIDLTGLDRLYKMDYEQIGRMIKKRVREEVGITVSVGIGHTKTIAKLASDYQKPDGLSYIHDGNLEAFLDDREVCDIWGFGSRWGIRIERFGLQTALQFYETPLEQVKKWMGKLGMDMWLELHGNAMYRLETEEAQPKSVSRTANFDLKTTDPDRVFAACAYHAARVVSILVAKNLYTNRVQLFLRSKDFSLQWAEAMPERSTNNYEIIIGAVRRAFEKLFRSGTIYRGTGVVVDVDPAGPNAPDIFGDFQKDERAAGLTKAIMRLNQKYGGGTATYLAALPMWAKRRGQNRTGPGRADGIQFDVDPVNLPRIRFWRN
ncbi:MAG: DNA polymerase IV [bacterium]|nr:DNA polymerase IV [bacterium]